MSTTTTDAPRTIRLQSSPFMNAPGLIAWAKNGYKFERDRKNMLDVICGTWPSLSRETVAALLAEEISVKVEGDAIVFTEPVPEPEIETKEYTIRIGVTVRAFASENFEAASWEEAVEKAKAYQPTDFLYRYDHDGIEGDELGYLREADDYESDEHEIDLRKEGEPFSWFACEIVKDLAKLHGIECGYDTHTAQEAIGKLIERARAACTKDDADADR